MLCIVWDGYGRRCEQHATIDGPPVECKQERKVRGIGEGAANQREEAMEDGSLHSLRFVVCHHAVHRVGWRDANRRYPTNRWYPT